MITSNFLELETRSKYIVSLPLSHKSNATDELLVSSHQIAENALNISSLEDELLVGGRSLTEKILTTNSKEYEHSTLVQKKNFCANDREQELLLMTEMLEHENRYR
jgi:hypothetical protein